MDALVIEIKRFILCDRHIVYLCAMGDYFGFYFIYLFFNEIKACQT